MEPKKIEELRKMPIFNSLSLEELSDFASIFKERTCQDQEKIFSEKEFGNVMFIIKNGAVKILRKKGDIEEELIVFLAGDFFGEVGLFRDVLRTASAIAVKQTLLFEVYRNDFNKFILEKPYIGVKILYYMVGEMAKRLRLKNREGEKLAF